MGFLGPCGVGEDSGEAGQGQKCLEVPSEPLKYVSLSSYVNIPNSNNILSMITKHLN